MVKRAGYPLPLSARLAKRVATLTCLVFVLGLGSAAASVGPDAPRADVRDGANLWVDSNGGSCVRSRTPSAHNDAAACSSLNAAYQAAFPGDVVHIASGTYVDQNIRPKAAAKAPQVVMQPAAGAAVVVKELDVSAAWLTIRNVTVVPMEGLRASDKILDVDHGANNLKLERIRLDGRINGVRQVRDGLGISGDTDHVTIKNSDICCIQDQKLIQIQTYGTSIQNRHLTLSGNMIHDDWQTDSGKHLECLWLEGVSDLVLNGNHFYDCALNAILGNADEGGTLANWTIVNNVFESADTGAAGIPPDIDGCAERHSKSNWLIAYNYFARGLRLTSCGGGIGWLTLRGNIGASGDSDCGDGAAWEYNIWAARACSRTDRRVGDITSTRHYMAAKPDRARGPGDYRPATFGAPQVNAGHPTLWPSVDAAGAPRPLRITSTIERSTTELRVKGVVVPARAGLQVGLTLSERRRGTAQKAAVKRTRPKADGSFVVVFQRWARGPCVLSTSASGDTEVSTNARADAGPYERVSRNIRTLDRRINC